MSASLNKLPIIAGILKRTNLKASNKGLVAVMKEIVAKTGSRMIIENKNEKLINELRKEPTVVICNHPAQADVLILLAGLEERKDSYIIASHQFLNILPAIDKYIIPVYIGHRLLDANVWKNKIFNRFHESTDYSEDEAHQKNINSIDLATKKVNRGGLVVIFPAAEERNYKFMPGVGHLVANLRNGKKVNIVMAYIKGTSNWDYLRIVPFLSKLLPEIRLTFSPAFKATEVTDKNGKTTAQNLEKRYYQWLASGRQQNLILCRGRQ